MDKKVPPRPQGQFRTFVQHQNKSFLCTVRDSSSLELTQQLHYHDYYQIYFVTRGSLNHDINGVSLRVMRGDCFIIPPYTSHKIELDQENASFISISFYEKFLTDFVRNQPAVADLFSALNSSSLLVRIVLQPQDAVLVEQAISLAKDEFKKADSGYECILQGQLATILVIFSRAYKYIKRIKHDSLLLPCLEYINANFASSLTAKEVANWMHLSDSTFYRYFKQIVGHSFKDYLTMIRIRNACSLLRDETVPISQIASMCGYSNYSVFYRAFLLEMQISPANYRKLSLSSSALPEGSLPDRS